MGSITTLRLLANIRNESLDSVELVYQKAGLNFPSLDEPFNPPDPAETLRQDKEVAAAVNNIMAAAAQISTTVCDPIRVAVNSSNAFHISSCLNAASELNVVEILREAGPRGADAKDIAASSKADPGLIARILRLLATHHIFREVSPGVFANNRVSSTLDKGKPSSVLSANREDRFTGFNGIAAPVECTAELCGKCGVYLGDSLLSPSDKLPFNLAYSTDEPMFSWMQDPKNRNQVSRFAVAMQGTGATEPPEVIFQGFDWSVLPSHGIIVDVGGGIGHSSLTIAKRYPHLRIINEDLGPALEISNAAVFMLRYTPHDWPDKLVGTMLGHLRDAALPTTRLVIIEMIQPFASGEELADSKAKQIPGAARPTAAPPFLPNWGAATADVYFLDLNLHVLLGGVERTLDGLYGILLKSGWKLVEVHHCSGSN
ncbi:S-adenosyl-L-methionine-dependent methyltransferase [Mycena capillaripes]|nr:S-adenosyl-L-methionine-dependent methyltransferase [Mycena capillaripes]